MRVAIVGGGPGGLTLARLLQMNGADVPEIEVKVYERDVNRSARVQGATLNLNEESGLMALRKAGLMDAFKKAYRPGAEKMVIVDRAGKVLLNDVGGEGLKEERPEIDRGPLRELLLGSLKEGTVVWDSQFVSLREVDGITHLEFKNGTTATADLMVAADGASSKVRPYLTPIQPVYSGVTAIEGVVYDSELVLPRLHQWLDGGKICVLGDEKTLFLVLKGDGSIAFYAGFNSSEFWFRENGIDFSKPGQVVSWFEKEFSGWDRTWVELFEKASAFIPRPQYCAPLDQTWEARANLTLLGDAAHVMPPYAGEGVNMAMLDALELAECLFSRRFSGTREAIAAYEKMMRERNSEAAKQTMEFTRIFHSPDAISYFLEFFKSLSGP